jgi:NADH dehydrogenase
MRRMTVMVTGASGPLGHALVALLVGRDEVRAAVRRPEAAEALRALGAKVTVGRLDDADALAEVLRRVETVVHLVGGPNQPDDEALWDANHGSVVRSLTASKVAGVRRFVLVSVPGASADAPRAYLRARGLAEEAVTTSGLEYAVIRSTHVYGLGSLWFAAAVQGAQATPPLVVGDGSQQIAPAAVEDLAAALAAADDRRDELAGTWCLEGPETLSADALTELLVGAPAGEHVRGDDARRRLEGLLGIPISAAAVESFEAPSRADAPDAASAFGIERTPLVEGLRRALTAAAVAPGG